MATLTKRDRADFINFIIDATKDETLVRRFLKCKTPAEIQQFFKDEGYDDIPLNDCEDILKASQSMHGRGVDDAGEPKNMSTVKSY